MTKEVTPNESETPPRGPFVWLVTLGLASALIGYGAGIGGIVAERVWAWHVEPTVGFPLGWRPAAGTLLLLALSRNNFGREDNRDHDERLTAVGMFLMLPWLVLSVAWVLK